MSTPQLIVTIDGPSGVGKSTVSRTVASRLGFTYLDTGAMYRGAALVLLREAVDLDNEKVIFNILKNSKLTVKPALTEGGHVSVFLGGEDVSSLIRTPEMSMSASKISAIAVVRDFLTRRQREIGEKGRIVVEGRDMGTVVFPWAAHKFFLDAVAEERCRRRVNQLKQTGQDVNEGEILKMLIKRDRDDSEREIAPLKRAKDAALVDTTHLSIEEVCETIVARVRKTS